MTTQRDIKWWKENVKKGDKLKMAVSGENSWKFGTKTNQRDPEYKRVPHEVVFDQIVNPNKEMKEFFGPSLLFQKDEKDLGDKAYGIPINPTEVVSVSELNGNPLKQRRKKQIRVKQTTPQIDEETPIVSHERDRDFSCPCGGKYKGRNKKMHETSKMHRMWSGSSYKKEEHNA